MSIIYKYNPDSYRVLYIKGEDYFKPKGFKIIDKSTGRPITERRYAELYNKVTGENLPYSWKQEGVLEPSKFNLFLRDDGILVEMVDEMDPEILNFITVKMKPARILESNEVEVVEVRLK